MGEYQEINEDDSVIVYPNYKEADDIVCGYLGCDTMEDSIDDWEYLKEKESEKLKAERMVSEASKMKAGGRTRSKPIDGLAVRGKTKGRFV